MTSREKVNRLFNRQSDENVIWVGHPNDATIPIYAKEWGIEETREAIYKYLEDDCRWILADSGYKHPNNEPAFNTSWKTERKNLSSDGAFANFETIKELDEYPWPNPDYLDFSDVYKEIDKHQDKMIFTGMWSPFFHLVADFFGMENYFIKMYENPELVQHATKRIVDFFVEANDRFFEGLGDRADVMFFGNDFGTQLDLFVSPALFDEFVMPSFRRLIEIGKKHNKKIMLHSCGSIYRIIPTLIEAGVDIIHPIQAAATGMSANELEKYKDKLIFVGGIDAQTFFVNATPQEMAQEVKRVKKILGPSIIVSPSHEEILPNVPADNILAMAKAGHAN